MEFYAINFSFKAVNFIALLANLRTTAFYYFGLKSSFVFSFTSIFPSFKSQSRALKPKVCRERERAGHGSDVSAAAWAAVYFYVYPSLQRHVL